MKELKRKKRGNVVGGVAAGMAEYFDIDVTLVRIGWVFSLFAGFGFVLYIICLIIIPEERGSEISNTQGTIDMEDEKEQKIDSFEREKRKKILGYGLVVIGGYFLLDQFFPIDFYLDKTWPVLLIVLGVYIAWQANRRGK